MTRWRRAATVAGWAVFTVLAVEIVFGRGTTAHVLGVPIPVGINWGDLLLGVAYGMLFSLLAFGLILVYLANRIINFAHAGLGLVPAVLALLLLVNKHWPYPAAVVVMLLGSALMGAGVELAMRRFTAAPRMVATVVTIGFAQLFVYLELQLPQWVGGSSGLPYDLPTPYSNLKFSVDGVVFTGDYIAIVVATAAICLGLAVFLRFTRAGIAVRAAAENADRALLLGVPVARLSTLVWVIAGVCSGIAIFLQAPITAPPAGGTVSPLTLLYGLAAAVIARMESLPVAFGAGIGIGIVQQASFFGSSKPDDAAAVMLPVILVALLHQRRRLSRAFDSGGFSFRALQEFRPIPMELRRLPEVVRTRAGLIVLTVAIGIAAPWIFGRANAGFLTLVLIAAMVSISLVVLAGWAGQISLGQWALAGVGAVIAGGLATRYQLDFWLTLAAAAVAGAAIAVVIGVPALRLPGLFLSVVTLGLGASVQYGLLSPDHFSWLLPTGYIYRPVLYGRFDTTSDVTYYYLVLVIFALGYLCARSLRHSRSGRVFIGLRDNVRAAQGYGANPVVARLAAFALSGAIAAVAGALSAYQSQVDANSFSMDLSLTAFLYAVVGGLTSLPGAVAATVLFEAIGYFGGQSFAVISTGVGTAIVLMVVPGGLAGFGYQLRDAWLRWIAQRRGLDVPSLRPATGLPGKPDAGEPDQVGETAKAFA